MTLTADESRALWRQRREERRAKQREQNVHRAAAMHQARLLLEKEQAGLAYRRPKLTGKFFIGCSGWYYWHWKNCFYPEGSPSSQWFNFYASQFSTVELNAPFYSWPTLKTVETWNRQATSAKFIYTIKANEMITHTKRFVGTKTLVKDFYLIAQLLGKRMGCFLFQLPPSFRYSKASLKRIVGQLDPAYRNVVEFRHKSWWREDVYQAFRDANITFCSCSGPRLPDELVKTTDELYLRFHGTQRWYRHNYSPEELAVWTQRVKDSGADKVWAYFNNDREGYAIHNARSFLSQLKRIRRCAAASKAGPNDKAPG
ncbi:MAG TPA: DUF72 domain-containing protein [Tepidisphaeraceae bacterium]|jgi:uncharacterized protein YecE (DUF72 family)